MTDFDLSTWDFSVRRTYKGKPIGAHNWEQIPVQSVFIKQPLSVVKIQNRCAPPRWRYASTLTVFANQIKLFSKRIYLNELTLIEIDKQNNSYQLDFWFPWYHAEIKLEVWQKPREQDCDICTTLNRIEQKVTDISDYGRV